MERSAGKLASWLTGFLALFTYDRVVSLQTPLRGNPDKAGALALDFTFLEDLLAHSTPNTISR